MPKTREEIKHDPVVQEVWRDNRTQIGGLWFDPLKIRPMGDHILVELDSESSFHWLGGMRFDMKEAGHVLYKPDVALNRDIGTRTGTVIAVGPGKWIEKRNSALSWVLNPLVFKPTTLKPGDRVAIGHFSDWESWSSDFEGRGRNVVLCQEADVRIVIGPVRSLSRRADHLEPSRAPGKVAHPKHFLN